MNINKYYQYINIYKTHLIFDFDKTLFHLLLNWDTFFDPIRTNLKKIDSSLIDDYEKGKVDWSIVQNLYVKKGGKKIKEMIISNNIHSETKLFRKEIPNLDLLKFIETSDDHKFHIWTSNTKELIKPILKKYSILGKFDKIISRSEVTFLKPNPEGFIEHINKREKKNEKFLFIGNSQNDREAAKRAGIDFYLIDYFK